MFHLLLRPWVNLLVPAFFGIGQGPSSAEKGEFNLLSSIGQFGTRQGEGDITKAQNFWSALLSGDMSKISQVLGPEISAINKQGQERKKTMFEFGNRGGGTNAAAQSIDDNTLSSIRGMVANLTGGAATSLASLGTNLLSEGTTAGEAAFGAAKDIHDQNAAMWKDIFNSISEVVGMVGGLPGISGTTTGKVLTGAAGAIS